MHKLFRLSGFILLVAIMLIFISFITIISAADENTPLYIVLSISNKEYDGTVSELDITYYSNPEHTEIVEVLGITTIDYYLSADTGFTTPFTAPEDAGSYVVRVFYHDNNAIPDFEDTTVDSSFQITKRDINFAVSDNIVYGNDPEWIYSEPYNGTSFAPDETYSDLDIDFSWAEDKINVGTYPNQSSAIGNNNYNAAIFWSLVIAAKDISMSIQPVNVTYGDNITFNVTLDSGNLVFPDLISDLGLVYEIDGEAFNEANLSDYGAGTYTISASGSNNNYNISFTNNTLTIARYIAQINISGSCVYGTNVNTQSIYNSTLTNSLAYEDLYEDLGVSFYVENSKPQVGSSHRILSNNTNSNYSILLNTANLIVTPLELKATIDDKYSVYGNTPTYSITLLEGYAYASGDNINALQANFTGAGRDVGSYIISATAASPNYTVTFTDGNLTVTERAITIIVSNINITYGGIKTFQCSLPSGQNLPYMDNLDMLAIEIESDHSDVGTYQAEITYNNANYIITFQGGQYIISMKSIEIKINDLSIIYGEIPVYSCSLWNSTLVGADTIEDLNITYIPESMNYGDRYSISGSYDNPNYDVTFRLGSTINIAKRAITVIINNVTITYGDSPVFTYQLQQGSALAAWDNISALNIVCTSSGVNVIDAPVQISRSYNNNNYAVTFIEGTHLIEKRNITIKVKDINKQFGQVREFTASDIEIVSGSMALGEPLSGLNINFLNDGIGTVVGSYTLNVTTSNSNYNVTINPGTLTIRKCKVNIEVESLIKAYGDKDSEIEFTYDIDGINFTGKLDREPGEKPGTYEITLGNLTAGDNYDLILSSATLTIDDSLTTVSYAGIGVLGISILGALFLIIRKLIGAVII